MNNNDKGFRMHIRSYIGGFVSLALAVSAFLTAQFDRAVAWFEHVPWAYSPPDPGTSLELDRIGHVAEAPRSSDHPFLAFIERALSHLKFSAGGFRLDPGRCAA